MFREPKLQSLADFKQIELSEKLFGAAVVPLADKIDAFPRFASRRALAKFIVRHEIFRRILNINGSIIECGVLHGAGLFTFAQLSAIYEPYNHTRQVVGFDTFSGVASVDDADTRTGTSSHLRGGALAGSSLKELRESVELFDTNRPLAHIRKIELVPGDIRQTAPEYLAANPHLVVSLLYLDLDLHAPTLAALKTFVPRMPKGALIVFDELNTSTFPGETIAVDEALGLRNLRIERFAIDPYVSYCVL